MRRHLFRNGFLLATVFLLAGCGTTFKYHPKLGQTFPPISMARGVEIAGGTDERPKDERRPVWSKSVESIVAHALGGEIQHDGLFPRVKIHLAGPSRLSKFSYYVQFRVEAFEMAPESGFAEKVGRSALLESLGWRGALISASIPMTWRSQVKVDFEIFDAQSKQMIFSRSYSETRSLKVNGYQGDSQQIQQTSDCLEAVVGRFVADFSRLAGNSAREGEIRAEGQRRPT
jgi:hypothetical protein